MPFYGQVISSIWVLHFILNFIFTASFFQGLQICHTLPGFHGFLKHCLYCFKTFEGTPAEDKGKKITERKGEWKTISQGTFSWVDVPSTNSIFIERAVPGNIDRCWPQVSVGKATFHPMPKTVREERGMAVASGTWWLVLFLFLKCSLEAGFELTPGLKPSSYLIHRSNW